MIQCCLDLMKVTILIILPLQKTGTVKFTLRSWKIAVERLTTAFLSPTWFLSLLLLDVANASNSAEIPSYLSQYLSEQETVQLKAQLPMLPGAIHAAFPGSVKKITSVRTVCDALNKSEMTKQMLSIVHKLVVIYLTYPVTSATAERSFSALRRVKTYLRSRMTSQRLNNLFLLYVHQSRTDSLDLTSVAKDFASSNARRVNYFGRF